MTLLNYASMKTPVGNLIFIGSRKDLHRLHFCFLRPEAFLTRHYPKDTFIRDPKRFDGLKRWFISYFEGARSPFPGELFLDQGSLHQKRVWKTLMEIPFGEVRSYQWVGERLGIPRGSRAVGQANGKNPFPILVPCHRVIYQNGTLGGYTGGVDIKRRLLEFEGWMVHQDRLFRRDFP